MVPDGWDGWDAWDGSMPSITAVHHSRPDSGPRCTRSRAFRRSTGAQRGPAITVGEVATSGLPTIPELVAEGARSLAEPFSRAALINWASARRPDVGVSSIATHIQSVTVGPGPDPADGVPGRRPLLRRVDRGATSATAARSPSRRPAGVPPGWCSSRPRAPSARLCSLVSGTRPGDGPPGHASAS